MSTKFLLACLTALLASVTVNSAPIFSRDNTTSTSNSTSASTDSSSAPAGSSDLLVVQFAALAENLEATFYDQALKKFGPQDFTNAGFASGQAIFDQLSVVLSDEQTHLTTLQSVAQTLGGDTSKTDSCQFNFDSALSTVQSFLATARVLEFVGIDAYIGGTTLISDKSLLVSAAEITTVEARHSTIMNIFNSGSAISNAFDMVLTPQQVLSVAAPFVSGGCDPVGALGLTPTPALTVTNTGSIQPGTTLTFGGDGLNGMDTSSMFCNMIVGGATQALSFPVSQCVVPDGIDGAVHIFIVSSSTSLSANIVNQDETIIVAGPAIAFIDTQIDEISQILLSQSSGSQSSSSSSNSNSGSSWNSGSGSFSSGSGQSEVITEVIVEEVRESLGITPDYRGTSGGAIPLGWM